MHNGDLFVIVLVLMAAGFGYAVWEEHRDWKIMHALFFEGLTQASQIAEEKAREQAEWDALMQKAKVNEN